jgi:hypothetical protein
MLNNLFTILNTFFKFITHNKSLNNLTVNKIKFKSKIFGAGAVSHGIYTMTTSNIDSIIVTKKYKFNISGFTNFMIIDDKGNHYNVNNSLWYWKWNSLEDWHKIKENEQLFIKYYGIRWALFGLFPNVVMSQNEIKKL